MIKTENEFEVILNLILFRFAPPPAIVEISYAKKRFLPDKSSMISCGWKAGEDIRELK